MDDIETTADSTTSTAFKPRQITHESEFYFMKIEYRTTDGSNISSNWLRNKIFTLVENMFGMLGAFPVEVVSADSRGQRAIIAVLRKHAVQLRTALTFLHENMRTRTELEEIRIIKASPYLHSLSHDSRNFFGQFFPCNEMYTVPAGGAGADDMVDDDSGDTTVHS